MDENGIGMPTEGYGFGNDAQGFLSPPPFDAAAITIGNADVSASITLIYPKILSIQDWRDFDLFTGKSPSEPSR